MGIAHHFIERRSLIFHIPGRYSLDIGHNGAQRSSSRCAFGPFVPSSKTDVSYGFAENRAARRRLIAGDSYVDPVCSAGGRAGSARDCDRRYGPVAMTVANNDGLLRGPANPKRIDIHSPAEMRHWVRELSRPAAKLNEAINAVGPLVADVRDYLRKHSLYGRPR
jgi:Protein of unknown function (DUF3606)